MPEEAADYFLDELVLDLLDESDFDPESDFFDPESDFFDPESVFFDPESVDSDFLESEVLELESLDPES